MASDAPTPRKVMIIVTPDEWRALRVAAAEHDTSIQGYVTDTVLKRLSEDGNLKRARLTRPASPGR